MTSSSPRRRGRRRPGPVLIAVLAAVLAVPAFFVWSWATETTKSPGARSSTQPSAQAPPSDRTSPASTPFPTPNRIGDDRVVSVDGSDKDRGTATAPWRTLRKALTSLRPGDRLTVMPGTYEERLNRISIARGTKDRPIQVSGAAGKRPVIKGLLWLADADYWSVKRLNVTWSSDNSRDQHMVKFSGGTGWSFSSARVWGARSYAAILVTGEPDDWTLSNLYVHTTYKTHGSNQDHLIYVSSSGDRGVIQRNILADSPNGRAIKIGPPSSGGPPVGDIEIRYNTMYSNLGPTNIQLSRQASDTNIYRNILATPGKNEPNVSAFLLSGKNNRVYDNLSHDADGIVTGGVSGLRDTGGNIERNPRFADAEGGDFHPQDGEAKAYGRYAPRAG